MWRLCRYLGDVQYADDLAQETYERAIGSIHRFRADGSARGWLLTIARRTCVDHTRRAGRRRRTDRAVLDDTTAGSIDGNLTAPDMSGRIVLDDVLAHLDVDRRSAFVLTQVLGLQYDEAAEVLDCPIGTIRSRAGASTRRPGRDDARTWRPRRRSHRPMTTPTSRAPGTPSVRRTTVHDSASTRFGPEPTSWTDEKPEQETTRG